MGFILEHKFSVFCILGLIWLGIVIFTQFKFKNRGILLKAVVSDIKQQSGYFYPVFSFEYDGRTITSDGHMGYKQPLAVGTEMDIYYLPSDKKGVMTPDDVKVKFWQIGLLIACIAYVVLDLTGVFGK